ncbi:hypothetical protein [Desulfotruncus arcticus]|uniref:hypothetical protein n=1 Tax=Desulfotruncus arcticus TaxID=341036 RepID=UPI001042175B|nr:hypothetical protein [Desulfotruncus arcticus]
MRETIRQKLATSLPAIGGRVYEPHAAGAKTVKPYLVLRLGSEDDKSSWVNFQRHVEIWPCVARTTFGDLDQLGNDTVAAMHNTRLETLDNDAFTLMYQGVLGDDTVVDEWDVLTRCLRFTVMALRPGQVPETVQDDPWLTALASWTAQTIGQDWTIYVNRWPRGYMRPSVLWRLSGYRSENAGKAIYKVVRQISGHVLGRTPNDEMQAALLLLGKLEESIKIPLNLEDRTYMTIQNPSCDFKADAISKGQLTFNLFRYTSRPAADVPLMMRVGSRGTIS